MPTMRLALPTGSSRRPTYTLQHETLLPTEGLKLEYRPLSAELYLEVANLEDDPKAILRFAKGFIGVSTPQQVPVPSVNATFPR